MLNYLTQRLHIDVINSIKKNDLKKAVEKFIPIIKEYIDSGVYYLHFYDALNEIDTILEEVNRQEFIDLLYEDEFKQILLSAGKENVKLDHKITLNNYIDRILCCPFNETDSSKYQQLSKSFPNFVFKYLAAKTLADASFQSNKQDGVQASLKSFEKLASQIPDDQLVYFSHVRANILYRYLSYLSPQEAVVLIEENLKNDWLGEDAIMRDHLVIRHNSIKDALKLHNQLQERFEETITQYEERIKQAEIDHVTMLGCFTGVMALIIGSLGISAKASLLYDNLSILLGLCLCLVAALGFLLGALRSYKYFVCSAICFLLLCGLIFINSNKFINNSELKSIVEELSAIDLKVDNVDNSESMK